MPYINIPWGHTVYVTCPARTSTTYESFEYTQALRKYHGGTMGKRKVRTEYYPDGKSKDIWQDVFIEPLNPSRD